MLSMLQLNGVVIVLNNQGLQEADLIFKPQKLFGVLFRPGCVRLYFFLFVVRRYTYFDCMSPNFDTVIVCIMT